MVGKLRCPFGIRLSFRGFVAVSFRECSWNKETNLTGFLFLWWGVTYGLCVICTGRKYWCDLGATCNLLLSEPWHPTRVTWSICPVHVAHLQLDKNQVWKITWKLDRCHYHYQLWLCTMHFLPYQMIKFHHLQPLSMPNKHVKHAVYKHILSSMSPENLWEI